MARLGRRLFWLLGLVVSLSLLGAATRTAGRYFYCAAMGLLPYDPCAVDAPREKTAALTAPHHDCCAIVNVSALPNATASRGIVLPPAALVRACAAPALGARSMARVQPPLRACVRGPPLASERQATLMVFLT